MSGERDAIYVVYNEFKSAIQQRITGEVLPSRSFHEGKLLPLDYPTSRQEEIFASCFRNTSRCKSSGAFWNRRPSTAPGCPPWTQPHATPLIHRQPHLNMNKSVRPGSRHPEVIWRGGAGMIPRDPWRNRA